MQTRHAVFASIALEQMLRCKVHRAVTDTQLHKQRSDTDLPSSSLPWHCRTRSHKQHVACKPNSSTLAVVPCTDSGLSRWQRQLI